MKRLQFEAPLDRWVAIISLISASLLGILLFLEFYAPPFVKSFNGSEGWVTAGQTQLVLTFNRPMDPESIIQNLEITPSLPGQPYGSGRRFIYRLEQPPRYGETYTLRLDPAVDYQGRVMRAPFASQFSTPDPQFLGLGVEGEQSSRLILQNLATKSLTPLSPVEFNVTQFRATVKGSQPPLIYYFGNLGSVQDQDLYQISLPDQTTTLILDHRDAQNLRFQTSPDGEIVVVERIDPQNPIQTELWIRESRRDEFKKLELGSQLIGDFLVTPDNSSLIVAQGQGLAIIPLNDRVQADYLPQFGQILTLKADGSAAAMVTYNQDFTRSLWILTNSGNRHEVFKSQGSLLAAQFDPAKPVLYCLTTQVSEADYTESPRILAIDLKTGDVDELVTANFPAELAFSVAPDGQQLLYSLMIPSEGILEGNLPISRTGQPIVESYVWSIDLSQKDYPITPLGVPMANVQWIP